MCKGAERKYASLLRTRSRKDYRAVIGLVIGYNLVVSHVRRMDTINNGTCRKCSEVGMTESLEYLQFYLGDLIIYYNITMLV